MENKKSLVSEILYSLQIAGMVALALAIAVPVFFYMRKANNIEDSLTAEREQAFTSQTAEIKGFAKPILPSAAATAGIDTGARATKYLEVGSAILSVTPQNITKFTSEEFKKLGETQWSLMNTVASNQAVPSVVSIVFDNRGVVEGFLSRATTQALINDPAKLIGMIKNNDPVIERFFKSPAVLETLDNEPMMLALNNSNLFYQLLQSKTGQYFIRNPQIARNLVNDNKTLAPLLQNESLKMFLQINPQTKAAAEVFYK